MCGISGKLYFDSDRVVDHEVIRRMSAALAHRGPDGEGVYVKGPVGLGHRRLAIIDLSEDARQPIANEDGTVMMRDTGFRRVFFPRCPRGLFQRIPVSCVLILEAILQGLQADKRRLLASTRLVSVALGILIAAEK